MPLYFSVFTVILLWSFLHPSAGFLSQRRFTSSTSNIIQRISCWRHSATCSYPRKNNALFSKEPTDSNNESEEDVESARRRLEQLMGTNSDEEKSQARKESSAPPFSLEEFLSACQNALPPPNEEDFQASRSSFDEDLDDEDEYTEVLDDAAVLMESLLPPPPPMSTMERARRLHEIQLLEQLEEGDEASEALWELWYSERGLEKQEILGATDSLLANPDTWNKCEEELRELLEDTTTKDDDDRRPGIYFVEAVNRLATLYFLQGRMEDSYTLCRLVLHLKPWHFGALSGIVQVCIGMSNREEARFWAQQRLPTLAAGTSFPPFTESGSSDVAKNPRRQEWCRQAIRDARVLMKRAERNTAKSLGAPEDYYKKQSKKKRQPRPESKAQQPAEEKAIEDQEDAWQ